MEHLPAGWLTEFEMQEEDSVLMDNMDSFDDLTLQRLATLFEGDIERYEGLSSCPMYTTSSTTHTANSSFALNASRNIYERPTEQPKSATTESWNSSTSEQISSPEDSSVPKVSQFGNSVGSAKLKHQVVPSENKCFTSGSRSYVNDKCITKTGNGRKRSRNSSVCTQDHVIAERKRREKLTQQFIALSAIVPGLKRTDKISVLEDCMKYVKDLQDQVKTLEEQTTKTNMESAVFVKKYLVSSDSDSSSTDGISSEISHEPLPEVEARISGRNVLIKIHCENRKGITAQALLETEKLNLIITSSSIMPFGSSTLDIILLAETDAEFNITVTGLVRKLRSSLVEFMGKNDPQN